jgi:tRNA (guanine-N7-)-methyltransferase
MLAFTIFLMINYYTTQRGRITKAQKHALHCHTTPLLPLDGPLNLSSFYPLAQPVVIDVGFGMGDALLEMAYIAPHFNYLGVDVYKPGIGRVLSQLQQQPMLNVRLMEQDIRLVLPRIVPHSVTRVQLFFPDPWPKKRHHKRRLVQPSWLHQIAMVLQPGGGLHMATDCIAYATYMHQVCMQHPCFFQLPAPSRPITKFEKRATCVMDWYFQYQP